MDFACASFSFQLLTLENAAKLIKMIGFNHMDVGSMVGRPVCVVGEEVESQPAVVAERLRRVSAENEIGLSDFFAVFAHPVNTPDLGAREANLLRFRAYVRLCRLAGIPGITVMPGYEWKEIGYESSYELARNELARLLSVAQEAGLRLSMEAHMDSIVEKPSLALQLLRDVTGLKLTLDYAHFIARGDSADEVHPLVEYAAHFHARQGKKGQMQSIWQEGIIDFQDILGRLRQSGYRGYLCLEYVWRDRWGNNRVDVLSETITLRDQLARFLSA